ncbi:MAG TPA: glycine cleavage system aminomethyltransferase GcvT [Thermoanaerobaculia bacterium]
MTDPGKSLLRTPLYDRHRAAGGRIVPFAGWEMPVQYQGVIDEHRAVRTAAGLFDVSHMGEVRVVGAGAEDFLQRLTPNDVSKLADGQAHYSALLTDEGTYIDDLLVYRIGPEEFLLVVNAANTEGDFQWIADHAREAHAEGVAVDVEDVSGRYALLALQGPSAVEILRPLAALPGDGGLDDVGYYRFARGEVDGAPALLSRTGYTGEDGFELYLHPDDAPRVWDRLLEAGRDRGLVPAGLGARDTLRLEAGMALYGHEIDRETTPWEANLGWTIKMDKGDFVGRSALAARKEAGVERRLVGFEVEGRGIAREGHPVVHQGREVGRVTSGTWSPTFEKALGMAYVPPALAEPGTAIELEVRGRRLPAKVVKVPFYKRPR